MSQLQQGAKRRPDLFPFGSEGYEKPIATLFGRVVQPSPQLTLRDVLSQLPTAELESGGQAAMGVQSLRDMLFIAGVPKLTKSVAERIKGSAVQKPLYHGTPQAFGEFDLSEARPGLYGKGIYLTEEPSVSSGYAFQHGGEELRSALNGLETVEGMQKYHKDVLAKGSSSPPGFTPKPLDAEGIAYHQNTIKSLEPLLKQKQDYLRRTMEQYPGAEGANIRPVFLNVKKAFYIDKDIGFDEAVRILGEGEKLIPSAKGLMLPGFKHGFAKGGEASGQIIYDYLHQSIGEKGARQVLQKAGYDGITHIGGQISGGKPHRVWIAFDPSQVMSAFEK